MQPPIKYALRQEGVSNTFTKGTYYPSIFADSFKRVKKRMGRISISFWRLNYALEEARQDHAARGHLWRQISYCLALLLFRVIGKVMP